MKILVALKQVPDTETKIKVAADGKSLDGSDVKWIVSPYDEYALEEALRLRETAGAEVTAVSVGGDKAKDVLRNALALGVVLQAHNLTTGMPDPKEVQANSAMINSAIALPTQAFANNATVPIYNVTDWYVTWSAGFSGLLKYFGPVDAFASLVRGDVFVSPTTAGGIMYTVLGCANLSSQEPTFDTDTTGSTPNSIQPIFAFNKLLDMSGPNSPVLNLFVSINTSRHISSYKGRESVIGTLPSFGS